MSETPPPPDDLLARAEDALRRAPVPDGPSAEAAERILDALRAAADSRVRPRPGRNVLRWVVRVAAVVAVGVALFAAAESLLRHPALAFGEVAQNLRDAHSLTYRVTVQSPRTKEPQTMLFRFKEPGLFRSDGSDGQVAVMDLRRGKTLILDAATRSALLLERKESGGNRPPEEDGGVRWLERLRRLADTEGEPAGRRRVGDTLAQGFRVKDAGDLFQDMTLWADPATRRPVLIEATVRAGDEDSHVAFSDFDFDPVLDDALFRLEPPEGYVLQKVETETLSPEEAVARLLRLYAESSGGAFPPRLDDWAAYGKALPKKEPGKPLTAEDARTVLTLARVAKFVADRNGDYGYDPNGAKLGDAGRIVFWYRPRGAAAYRVVYGDLRVGDATADRLPAQPKP
jgi:outer membrane lipoprotein-sorting protein